MLLHVDDVDLEIRIAGVVVHDRDGQIGAPLPRSFEPGEAHVILHVLLALDERTERALGSLQRQEQHLAGGLGRGADDHLTLIETQADTDPEPLIGFMENLDIVARHIADAMTDHGIRPPSIIKPHIEYPPAIRCQARARYAVDPIGQLLPG